MNNTSLFHTGWRPYIGWVGAFALTYVYILSPILNDIMIIYTNNLNFKLSSTSTGELFNLILAMLGFGGLRTYEKTKGINRDNS